MKSKLIILIYVIVCLFVPTFATETGFAQIQKEVVLESEEDTFVLENTVEDFFNGLGVDLTSLNNKTKIVLYNYSDKALINMCIAATVSLLVLMIAWILILSLIALAKKCWEFYRYKNDQRIMTMVMQEMQRNKKEENKD